MSVSFNTALNAYNNAAKIGNNPEAVGNNVSGAAHTGDPSFASIINNTLTNTANALGNAEATVAKSLVKQADITDVVTAITNAEVTLKTVIEVRNRLITAHQEILRMPI